MFTTIRAFHGESSDEGKDADAIRWFTTDEAHARSFGAVRAFDVRVREVLNLDVAAPEAWAEVLDEDADDVADTLARGGFAVDDLAYRLLEESGADALVITGWEGAGLCILISDDADVFEVVA